MRDLGVVLLLLSVNAQVEAHSWYDPSCCGGLDCHPVEIEDVIPLDNGRWKYLPTGTVFEANQIKPSRDQYFHVCIGISDHNLGRPYCLYILQGAGTKRGHKEG